MKDNEVVKEAWLVRRSTEANGGGRAKSGRSRPWGGKAYTTYSKERWKGRVGAYVGVRRLKLKKAREKWERRAAGYLTAKGRSRRVEARPRPSVGRGKGLRGVVLVLGVVGTFFADNHKATGLDRMTTTEYRPGNQRIGNQRITGAQEYELLESILGPGSPSKERRRLV